MRSAKHKHLIFLGIILLIIVGLLAGTFYFTKNSSPTRQHTFAPTPTTVPEPSEYRKISSDDKVTASWKIFTDDKLQYSIHHPENIILDVRQTSQGRINVFIFKEDKTASLPGKVTALYLADTQKSGVDGFTAFSRGDCGATCNIEYKNADWVTFNNAYGVRNPIKTDQSNWFLTDKNKKGSVINVYIGGYLDIKNKKVQERFELFEEMIKTITFNR
jgi:hypothetical protein